ncbi:4Fe-4S dicluster domain-containing protein [Pedobacter puniceum]|jgi:heterodisulfide reductase subunit C|uniref:4Fe-4S dicluster domain-containing protein n=1 Tax=Pedobacter puniceum TaxID=2666136 RepID=A0A7K0FR52_9SPHI|nr:(Fe-S)-binding protein [Pedobacter puniceum]MRX48111.1 4Fe-4S dicluster domain-containing protein [Pedobacter puniceum]
MLAQIIFILAFTLAIVAFTISIRKIIRNINLGKDINRTDHQAERWKNMLKVALGQSKMTARPVAGIMHILVYVGFIIINIEVLEIIIDGVFGTHRVFSFLGGFYNFLIASFEILALLVLLGVFVFLARRLVLQLKRFSGVEMTAWPKSDAIYILVIEVLLMSAFLTMNAADYKLQQAGASHYTLAGSFPVSQFILPLLPTDINTLIFIERFCWWFHILGILAFLNYLPFSKHFHIILAFPNTWYAKLAPKGEFNNMETVSHEVKAMLNPSYTPPAIEANNKFGAKDVQDLNWVQLMNAYTCTECGRCTSSCPANITGKLLSPRKIMMDTRDRMEEIGRNIDKHGKDYHDGKSLLDDYISREEIWACTTCNACVEACPVNIDPLSIILDLRRYAVMEESNVTGSLNAMFSNIENNGAPWKYSPADRFNWANK